MKQFAFLALLAPLAGCTLPAQVAPTPPPLTTVAMSAPVAAPLSLFTAEQLDQLLGPIALYPDALIALILPASTNADDILMAAQYLRNGGDPGAVNFQPWDESVQSLAHYPEIVTWMEQNLAWTRQLGDAFAAQPTDVMNAVQRLRARARAAGTLVDTPQQQIVDQNNTIMIVPAQPDVIYVPYYDPAVVYVTQRSYYPASAYFGFSRGFASGWWLAFGVDWNQRCVWEIDRHERERYWREHRTDWHRNYSQPQYVRNAPEIHRWHPSPERRRAPQSAPFRTTTFPTTNTWSRQNNGETWRGNDDRRDPRRDDDHRNDRSRDNNRDNDRRRNDSAPNRPTPAPAYQRPAQTPAPIPSVQPNVAPQPNRNDPRHEDHNRGRTWTQNPANATPPPQQPNIPPQNVAPAVVPAQPRGGAPYAGPRHDNSAHQRPSAPPPPSPPPPSPQPSPGTSAGPQQPPPSQTSQPNSEEDRRQRPFIRMR